MLWEFVYNSARHCSDETRHCKLGIDWLAQHGLDYTQVPQNTRIYFVKVGLGETLIEILIPQDTVSGIARYLAKRGPGLHHLGYACDDVPAEARRKLDEMENQMERK